jgi:hypothetical protein
LRCRGNERKPVFKDDSDPTATVGLNELVDKPVTMEGIACQVAAHVGIEEGDLHPRNGPFRLVKDSGKVASSPPEGRDLRRSFLYSRRQTKAKKIRKAF